MIKKLKGLFQNKCDVCGQAGKKMRVFHFLTYKGKTVEDICEDCEDIVFNEVL